MIDSQVLKLGALVLVQSFIAVSKMNVQRWIIKNWFTQGELPLWKWFNLSFIQSLGLTGFLGLFIVASYTLVTFPLGIWIGSYKMGLSYPVVNSVGAMVQMVSFPINVWIMSKAIEEMIINRMTFTGIVIIEVSKILTILGLLFMYWGNN